MILAKRKRLHYNEFETFRWFHRNPIFEFTKPVSMTLWRISQNEKWWCAFRL